MSDAGITGAAVARVEAGDLAAAETVVVRSGGESLEGGGQGESRSASSEGEREEVLATLCCCVCSLCIFSVCVLCTLRIAR